MIFFFSYMLTSVIVLVVMCKIKFKCFKLPIIKMKKFGLVFTSNKQHRINVGDAKIIQIGNIYYLKKNNKIVVLKNVKNVILKRGHMYFCACGEVKFIFECKNFYRYLNLQAYSKYFQIEKLKQEVLNEMINKLFDIKNCNKFKKYISFLRNVLKIEINNDKIIINSNKLNISYSLFYKLNNKIKRINIRETL